MRVQIEVTVWRGEIPESRHRVQAVAMDAAGRTLLESDESTRVTTFRSAAKPFQALALVERGHAERWRFTDEELALTCASHTGSAYHCALVRGLLRRLEIPESALACGYHEPSDPAALTELRAGTSTPSPVYNNCSGKHAGMLCLALSEGWPLTGYTRLDHPVQQLMRQNVAEVCGVRPETIAVAIDGCSVPVFALPLTAMARGFARLAAANETGDPRERSLARLRLSMMSWPRTVAGEGKLTTVLMEAASGRVVAKGGAEALECLGLPERGVGVAVKVEDGGARALGPAVIAVLERLEALEPDEIRRLDAERRPRLRNAAGLDVGSIDAAIRIPAAAGA